MYQKYEYPSLVISSHKKDNIMVSQKLEEDNILKCIHDYLNYSKLIIIGLMIFHHFLM